MTTVLAASLAVAVAMQGQGPTLPLSITRTWIEPGERSPTGTGLLRIEVLNTGQRTILAWGIKWVLKRPDGQPAAGITGLSTDGAGVPPEDRKMSLAPGATAQHVDGPLVPADSLFSDIAVTFVIFDDDTALGDEREIEKHFTRRRERRDFWQKMQTIVDDATTPAAEPSAMLSRIRQGMEAEIDPKFRQEPYYNEILARMSARRMELHQMTPDKVLTNIQGTISTQKANADAHVNRR